MKVFKQLIISYLQANFGNREAASCFYLAAVSRGLKQGCPLMTAPLT
jgi:hypothetical protein